MEKLLRVLRDQQYQGICSSLGFDPDTLLELIAKVKPIRNPVAHSQSLTRADALQIRQDWLGLNQPPSIFAALCPVVQQRHLET
jgi:hypothetical protein